MSCFPTLSIQRSVKLFQQVFFRRNSLVSSYGWHQNAGAVKAVLRVGSTKLGRGLHSSSAKLKSTGEGFHRPSDFDKKILVWTKFYGDTAQVPDEVTQTQMKKAKDVFRIRVNLLMIAATVLLCVIYIYSGQKAAERGESVARQNRLWHSENQKKGN